MKYKYSTFSYKRHLTQDEAEALKKKWEYEDENESRLAQILYKKKTNDYTVVLCKDYN